MAPKKKTVPSRTPAAADTSRPVAAKRGKKTVSPPDPVVSPIPVVTAAPPPPPPKEPAPSTNGYLGMDVAALKKSFLHNLKFALAKDEYSATARDRLNSLAMTVRDRLIERWFATQHTYYRQKSKRVYYLSLEFLIGRILGNALINLGLEHNAGAAMAQLGYRLEDMEALEHDAGLGNGGLGRLAACFLDSMATLAIPAYGYGIRYEYGIFFQRIRGGAQIETPDNWLRHGNPWEVERPEHLHPVQFYGRVDEIRDAEGRISFAWVGTQTVMAMAYDTPVPGYRNNTVNTMRLWSAKSTREFDLDYFNHGDYERAVAEKDKSETISKVLYPNDNVFEGRELRLKQEYFFVAATLQDIIRRYKRNGALDFSDFPDQVAIQLNDTHPSVAILDLMRILVDVEKIPWEKAWDITVKTFGYTNHTILPEALEMWPVSLFGRVLPRHLQIAYEINRRFLEEISRRWPEDPERSRRMSLVDEDGEKKLRMSHLAVVGSHSLNGVSSLHTEILRSRLFRDFFELWPERFSNKTNGISPRRWLSVCNPTLAELVSEYVGHGWVTDLEWLEKLVPYSEEPGFRRRWREVKQKNKKELARTISSLTGITVDPETLFDCQVKRIHEYKRQLLNVLHVADMYLAIKAKPGDDVVPRTVIFAGKAAPGYHMAKLIIRLIHALAEKVNGDAEVANRLKVVFLPNYGVSLAERIIPAADLSEQISTAGTEASGTGNMKFALNGAITIGTLDGANVEIRDAVGADAFFLFGLTAEEIAERRKTPPAPAAISPRLRRVLDLVGGGSLSPEQPDLFTPVVRSLLEEGDQYMLLADFDSYVECQARVSAAYRDQEAWTRLSILNVAHMGRFSSDRAIREYSEQVWAVSPTPVRMEVPKP